MRIPAGSSECLVRADGPGARNTVVRTTPIRMAWMNAFAIGWLVMTEAMIPIVVVARAVTV
jgi:hypothetical protein